MIAASAPRPPITVIGAGLAGSLAALALARRGAAVELIAPEPPGAVSPEAGGGPDAMAAPSATALSYGSVAGPAAADRWRDLEVLHGPLGWSTSAVVLHGLTPGPGGAHRSGPGHPLAGLLRRLPLLPAPLPFSRLDGIAFAAGLPRALAAAGVRHRRARVIGLEPQAAGWCLRLAAGSTLERSTVLLAAGAACRSLWPALPPRLRHSWAGVLLQPRIEGESRWLQVVRRGWMVFPARLQRPALERARDQRAEERWCVDVSLAPWGEGLLAGQITWLAADPPGQGTAAAAGSPPPAGPGGARSPVALRPGALPRGEPPDPRQQEQRLRDQLGRLDPALAALEARYHQVPVSYSSDGRPVAEAVAPGLWVLAGCSNAYSHLPALAADLAEQMLALPVSGWPA